MRYNKRTSSACDWPFHFQLFFILFRPLLTSPLSSQIIQLRMSVSHLCFAPRVFLTSCNFDEQKSPSSSWKQIVKFGLCSSSALFLWIFRKLSISSLHLIQSSFEPISADPMNKVSMKNGCQSSVGAYSCWYIIFSPVSIVQAVVFLHWERTKGGIKFSEKKSSLFFISQESPYLMPLA